MTKICKAENCNNPRTGRSIYCHPCRNALQRYGITTPERTILLEKQNHRCAICESTVAFTGKTEAVVDHDHNNGKLRGILCNACNRMIGNIDRDPELIIKNVKKYLGVG